MVAMLEAATANANPFAVVFAVARARRHFPSDAGAIVDEYLDEVARSPRPVDLVTAFALPADLLRDLAEVADRCPGRAIRVTTRD
ncbi:MAG: hypothetical protein ACJ72W_17605 [Actinoallomurus sp.]